jgi:hypothetical protein
MIANHWQFFIDNGGNLSMGLTHYGFGRCDWKQDACRTTLRGGERLPPFAFVARRNSGKLPKTDYSTGTIGRSGLTNCTSSLLCDPLG